MCNFQELCYNKAVKRSRELISQPAHTLLSIFLPSNRLARNLQSFLQENWHDHVGLQKIQIRYAAAEEIALMARRYLEQLL